MHVQTTNAPATRRHNEQTIHFCSDRCAERFDTNPSRYLTAEHAPEPMDAAGGSAIDPICGMTVDPHTALSATTGEERRFFCSLGCREPYLAEPAAAHHQLPDATATDPACEMSVDPQRALCSARHGRREFFCSTGCLQRYEEGHLRDEPCRTRKQAQLTRPHDPASPMTGEAGSGEGKRSDLWRSSGRRTL